MNDCVTRIWLKLIGAAALALLLRADLLAADAKSLSARVDYNRDIRPFFSDTCFKCHGPDENARKAKLRLDTKEGAYAALKGGQFIIKPGDLSKSEVYRRVATDDLDDLMPPADSKLALTKEQIDLVKRWIEQGAEWGKHWAFSPPQRQRVPKIRDTQWPRNAIDHFVLARLEQEKLKPAPEAIREQLIRRVTLDLTGLPPTLEEIDAFLADDSPEAYEKVVERLLASQSYGERMASDWLDVASYADTYGYQADVERDLSPWRDWVIHAFNENISYDQFILWQLAGDLLPNATRDQILATTFNRLHRQTNEGGSIDEEFRIEYVSDRIHTMGTALLGLTFECARCHDHKFDPISQKDYYRLSGFFNNIDESGLYSHFTQATPTPTLLLYKDGVEAKHQAAKAKIAAAEAKLEEVKASARTQFEKWLENAPLPLPAPLPAAAFAFDAVVTNTTPNSVKPDAPGKLVEEPKLVEGVRGQAMLFSGDNSLVCKGSGAFKRTDPFSFSLWLRPAEQQSRAVILHRSRAWSDSASRGYELLLENGKPAFALIHFWPGNAIGVRAQAALPTNTWSHLTITYDGSSRAAGMKLFLNGEPMALENVRDNLYKDILHRAQWGDSDVNGIDLILAGRFRDSGFKNGAIDDFLVFDRCLTPLEARQLAGHEHAKPGTEELFTYYVNRHDSQYTAALKELKKLRDEENDLVNDVREIMAMRDLPEQRPTFVLKRGSYTMPTERVEPGVPERILPWTPSLPRNRLGLARWLLDPNNPLTSRVAVNRIWKMHFGRGIVATVEDLGNQGQLPTHPELLDWLAIHFMDIGWDRKALFRLIATSATYRQSSQASPELMAVDPENGLLARGPKHRLQAEQIRDEALAASGLLSAKLGGPSVKPYQPAGLWEESGTGKSYTQDHGEKLYRRSLYTFWRRTAPPPSMLNFDATSREVCTARRETTMTPLQSLVLLNDPQYLEAARVLAEQLLHDYPDDLDARITQAFRRLTSRQPEPREREILKRLCDEQRSWFAANPAAAEKFLSTGERPRDAKLSNSELAATMVLASTLMNHDEFVMKR